MNKKSLVIFLVLALLASSVAGIHMKKLGSTGKKGSSGSSGGSDAAKKDPAQKETGKAEEIKEAVVEKKAAENVDGATSLLKTAVASLSKITDKVATLKPVVEKLKKASDFLGDAKKEVKKDTGITSSVDGQVQKLEQKTTEKKDETKKGDAKGDVKKETVPALDPLAGVKKYFSALIAELTAANKMAATATKDVITASGDAAKTGKKEDPTAKKQTTEKVTTDIKQSTDLVGDAIAALTDYSTTVSEADAKIIFPAIQEKKF